jgi:thiamine biosynthesis lipoprotein
VEISGRALATSGSYRKFYEMDGKKYSHTIDPTTGYPVEHNLLSVSVLASNCTNADAFATAFMVMGKEKTLQFIKKHPELNLDVYLIFSKEDGSMDTYHTEGFALISKDEL